MKYEIELGDNRPFGFVCLYNDLITGEDTWIELLIFAPNRVLAAQKFSNYMLSAYGATVEATGPYSAACKEYTPEQFSELLWPDQIIQPQRDAEKNMQSQWLAFRHQRTTNFALGELTDVLNCKECTKPTCNGTIDCIKAMKLNNSTVHKLN